MGKSAPKSPVVITKTEHMTVGEAARLLMISEERVRQLVKLDYIPRIGRGKFAIAGVVQGYIRFLKDEERRTSKSATASRMQDARAKKIDIEIAKELRELLPIEDAQAALDIFIGKVRSEFTGLPARVTRDLDLRRKLEIEANASLNRIADALRASADYFEKGGELPDGGSSDDT